MKVNKEELRDLLTIIITTLAGILGTGIGITILVIVWLFYITLIFSLVFIAGFIGFKCAVFLLSLV